MRDNKLANALHESFRNSPVYARLLARTARGAKTELNLAGLTDSAKSLILSCLQHEIRRPVFLVVQDNHVAATIIKNSPIYRNIEFFSFPHPKSLLTSKC